ncbi:Non-heme iron oxygenase ferredoxin subunit [Balamuthia mandrillaris]
MWCLAASLAELKAQGSKGKGLQVEVQRHPLALYWYKEEVHAMDDSCPHDGGPLSEGDIEDLVGDGLSPSGADATKRSVVVCPWHGYKFDINDGTDVYGLACDLRIWRVEVRGDEIWVDLSAPKAGGPKQHSW